MHVKTCSFYHITQKGPKIMCLCQHMIWSKWSFWCHKVQPNNKYSCQPHLVRYHSGAIIKPMRFGAIRMRGWELESCCPWPWCLSSSGEGALVRSRTSMRVRMSPWGSCRVLVIEIEGVVELGGFAVFGVGVAEGATTSDRVTLIVNRMKPSLVQIHWLHPMGFAVTDMASSTINSLSRHA